MRGGREEGDMSSDIGADWATFPFDEEVTFDSIPADLRTSAIHVSIVPEPAEGGVRILGRMPNGCVGSVTLLGKVLAAKLPFVDRVVRLQYLAGTRSVAVELTSYVS
jgi:hypothetical protein